MEIKNPSTPTISLKKKESGNERVGYYLPSTLKERIDNLAKDHHISASKAVEEMLEKALEIYEEQIKEEDNKN